MTAYECQQQMPQRQNHQVPEYESQLLIWLRAFNWVNYVGLAMFLAPIVFGYFAVHYWLLSHDLLLYYASLYAQLGLVLIAWKQL